VDTPKKVLIVGYRARSVCLINSSKALFIWGGPIAAAIQDSANTQSRVPLVEALNLNYPSFRPEKIIAEEIGKYLEQTKRFSGASISCLETSVELPIDPDIRSQEDKSFINDEKHAYHWTRAEYKWRCARPDFSYLTGIQKGRDGLVCAEFALGAVELNQGKKLFFMGSFRFCTPVDGRIVGKNVNELRIEVEIESITSKAGADHFESEFHRAAAVFAQACVDKALK
jgi:hypothetical protein